jgi:hypothetical protein
MVNIHDGFVREELWKIIPSFTDYEASNMGQIRNRLTKKIISSCENGGYYQLHLYRQKIRHALKLHRVIAEAFIPNPDNKEHVNHKNKDRGDNSVENLEWMTVQENNDHKVTVGVKRKDVNGRPIWKCDIVTRARIQRYDNTHDAALALNKDKVASVKSNIRSALCGTIKSSHGFYWEYEDYPTIEGEFWKEITFIPNVQGYQVSSEGRLQDNNGKMYFGHTDEAGYVRVCINESLYRMHILVAKAFLPNWHNKPHVNHKDGNRNNNRLYNLEWCTRSENMQHAYDTGLNKRKGKINPNP